MISAILLSAGESKRMNSAKALLPANGETFIRYALNTLLKTNVDDIVIVTGAYQAEIEAEIFNTLNEIPIKAYADRKFLLANNKTVTIKWNPFFSTGMMSSIQQGINALNYSTEAFFITLVDLPFLKAEDYELLTENYFTNKTKLSRFLNEDSPSHPVLISASFIPEILTQPKIDQGCSFLFKKYPQDVFNLKSSITRGQIDIDTPEDYHAHFSS